MSQIQELKLDGNPGSGSKNVRKVGRHLMGFKLWHLPVDGFGAK
jgi:hypothetical protein